MPSTFLLKRTLDSLDDLRVHILVSCHDALIIPQCPPNAKVEHLSAQICHFASCFFYQ